MPIGFLTEAERERLSRFPEHIPEDDLRVFFWLSEADQQAVNRQHDDHTRLGFALQLCTLRYLGLVPHDLGMAPSSAVGYVAEQLHVLPQVIEAYGARIATRTTHLQQVQRHLGFRRATPLDLYALQTWLLERALEHDKPTLLLQLACDKLRREHIVRPGITRLERCVAAARQQAHDETWRRLEPLLSTECQAFLDGLLIPEPTTGRTLHSWLRQEAVSPAAAQILATLKKIVFLQDAGVDQWDLSGLNPNRAKWLAQIGWKSTNQSLQRMAPERRYPVLVAFLQQAFLHHTDVAVELFDQCLWGCQSEAKQELEEFRKAMARSTNDKLTRLRELGQVLLDDDIEDAEVRAVSFARIPKKVLQAAIDETQGLIRPRRDDAIDFFGKRYSCLRQFVPLWLQTLTLRAQGPNETVLRAVEVIRDLDRVPTRRPVPKAVPMALVTEAWRPYIREPDGEISRRYYELCTLWHLRSALRSGRIWVEHSRRYADPDTYLIPRAEWSSRRLEVIRQTGTPGEGLQRLVERETALEASLVQVEKLLARKDSPVRIEDDEIILSPLEAENRPASADALENLITARLPQVELSDLLIEVDAWTHFSDHFVHAAGAETLRPTLLPQLYASILAHACNFGLEQMAHSTDISYRQLAWC